MSKPEHIFLLGFFAGIFGLTVCLSFTTKGHWDFDVYEQAVKVGAGHWEISPDGKEKKFVWTPEKKEGK